MSKKSTTDIYLAAAFLSMGAMLDNVNKDDPRHMIFEFTSSSIDDSHVTVSYNLSDFESKMDLWENQYANGILMVNAIKFKDALQRLKSIVHTHTRL